MNVAAVPKDCPLVPLPEGHGKLIDADAVVKTICNSCDGACDVIQCDCTFLFDSAIEDGGWKYELNRFKRQAKTNFGIKQDEEQNKDGG
jgi:hypothetical protein